MRNQYDWIHATGVLEAANNARCFADRLRLLANEADQLAGFLQDDADRLDDSGPESVFGDDGHGHDQESEASQDQMKTQLEMFDIGTLGTRPRTRAAKSLGK
jgi:hypothetical protein